MSHFRELACRHAAHDAACEDHAGLWHGLFRMIEERGFYLEQAQRCGGFAQTTADLEAYLLPHLVAAGDWPRFLHHALIAATLRGLAETLDDPEILRALAASGRADLAQSLLIQNSDAGRRALGWAALVSALTPGSGASYESALAGLRADLAAAALASGDSPDRDDSGGGERAWADVLCEAARRTAPYLRREWSGWIGRLRDPDLADRAWRAVAEGHLGAGGLDDPDLWQALGAIRNPEILAAFLPGQLSACWPPDPWPLLHRLAAATLAGGRELLWRTLVRRLAAEDAEASKQDWRRAEAEFGPVPWSVELVEEGRLLWPRLPEPLDVDFPGDPAIRLALAVQRLKREGAQAGEGVVVDALALLDRVDDGARLHGALRLLAADAVTSRQLALRRIATVGRHLAHLRWEAPPDDLARYFDLVATSAPHELGGQIEAALVGPAARPATLRGLVRTVGHPLVLEALFAHAEEYAAAVSPTAAEGFELRREALAVLAGRLAALRSRLDPVDDAVRRVLPEEEDAVREEAVRQLGAAGLDGLAAAVAAAVMAPALRLRLRLGLARTPAQRAALLEPAALFAQVADPSALDDELRALRAFHVAVRAGDPDSDREVRDLLDGIRHRERQVLGWVDRAHRVLDEQERRLAPALRDRPAALVPLFANLGGIEADLWLARLTPELAAVGARLGPARAEAELSEALERVVQLEAVPWPEREWVLVRLLGEVLPSAWGSSPGAEARRRAAHVLSRFASLPQTLDETPWRRELRAAWQRLLPWARLAEEILSGGPPRRRSLASARRGWTWLSPAQVVVVDLCFADSAERMRRAGNLAGADAPPKDELGSLACLLLVEAPKLVSSLVARLPGGTERDRLATALLRSAPATALSAGTVSQLRQLVDSEPEAARALLQAGLRQPQAVPDSEWTAALARAVGEGSLDPEDPDSAAIRRLLAAGTGRALLPVLARSTVTALTQGRKAGMDGLRWFLAVYLEAPLDEKRGSGVERRARAAQRAIDSSRRLDRPAPPGPCQPGDPVDGR